MKTWDKPGVRRAAQKVLREKSLCAFFARLDSNRKQNRITRFAAYLKSVKQTKALTAIPKVCGLENSNRAT